VPVAEVVFLVGAFLAAAAAAGAWPRGGARRPKRRPAAASGSRTHYRTRPLSEEEDDDEDVPDVDPSLTPTDRRALLDLWHVHRRARQRNDAPSMIAAAQHVLAGSRPVAVQAYATRVLAYGLALAGDARAAVAALASVSSETPALEDPDIEVEILCHARRYRDALECLQRAGLAGADVSDRMEAVVALAVRWQRAVDQLEGRKPCLDGADYTLVREAGRLKGRNGDAAEIGERMFEGAPDPDLAWAIAACWLGARDAELGLVWALRAASEGSREWERLDAPAFAALASSPDAGRVRAALEAPPGGLAPDEAPPGDLAPDEAPPGDLAPDEAPPGDLAPDEAPPGDLAPDEAPPGGLAPDEAPPGDLAPDEAP
jgi:hypothetical protein